MVTEVTECNLSLPNLVDSSHEHVKWGKRLAIN